nr:MAG TPA: AAA domain protein [Bacteriophage sp.]
MDIVKQNCITTFGGSVGKSAWSAYRAQGMMKIAILDADLIARKQHRFPNLVCMETIWLS